MAVSQITVGSIVYRAYDVSGGTLWLPIHQLSDETGNLIDKTNPLAVGGSYPVTFTATIANAASLSGAVDLGRAALTSIIMPAAWTAASLTFQVSADNSTFVNLYDGSVERTLTVDISRAANQLTSDWAAYRYLKIRSGTSATPVTQGASRALTLIGVV